MVIFSGDGNVITKQMFLQYVESDDLVHTQMDFEILNVKVFDHTGIIMQKGTSSGIWKGQKFSNREIASTVFIKQNDEWLAVLSSGIYIYRLEAGSERITKKMMLIR